MLECPSYFKLLSSKNKISLFNDLHPLEGIQLFVLLEEEERKWVFSSDLVDWYYDYLMQEKIHPDEFHKFILFFSALMNT